MVLSGSWGASRGRTGTLRWRKRSIKDRLDMAAKVEESEEDEEEDMGWMEKMKRPRMGMVADIVEKKTVAR